MSVEALPYRAGGGRRVLELYRCLLEHYGAQGWWPLVSRAGRKGYDTRGYHPGNYRVPANEAERFEVAVGAVLTQNTSWQNVEAAIQRLLAAGLLDRSRLLSCAEAELAATIRSSGYFNQKARKLRVLAGSLPAGCRSPTRSGLLGLWGIGAETADSILLYAYHVPSFVVDVYTRRLIRRLGWIEGRESYSVLQALFSQRLPAKPPLYAEYHALIVRHAKEHCRKRARCSGCPLLGVFCTGEVPTGVGI